MITMNALHKTLRQKHEFVRKVIKIEEPCTIGIVCSSSEYAEEFLKDVEDFIPYGVDVKIITTDKNDKF